MSHAVSIALERPDQPEVAALVDALDAYQKPLYPAESHHGIDMAALMQPHVVFAVARDGVGVAVGCGAVVVHAGWGELKRMYVSPTQRGLGIGRAIVLRLESEALARGCTVLRLETGILQPEAIGLYGRLGYRPRGPFAEYAPDPLSVFMERRLAKLDRA